MHLLTKIILTPVKQRLPSRKARTGDVSSSFGGIVDVFGTWLISLSSSWWNTGIFGRKSSLITSARNAPSWMIIGIIRAIKMAIVLEGYINNYKNDTDKYKIEKLVQRMDKSANISH